MNNRLINKMFFNMTVVQFFSMLIMELGVFVDGAIIGGCLGSEAMASYGFALPIATVISGVSTFFSLAFPHYAEEPLPEEIRKLQIVFFPNVFWFQ